jgi:hypothetical protein
MVFLAAYFWNYPPQVEISLVAAYLAIALGVGVLFGFVVNPILTRLIPGTRLDVTRHGDRRAAQARRRPWLEALTLPGEDGFFFVPLLVAGTNPVAALIASGAYAAIHYPEYPIKFCVSKAVALYLIAVLVLPHGLASLIVGHLLLDTFAYFVWNRGLSRPAVPEGNGH